MFGSLISGAKNLGTKIVNGVKYVASGAFNIGLTIIAPATISVVRYVSDGGKLIFNQQKFNELSRIKNPWINYPALALLLIGIVVHTSYTRIGAIFRLFKGLQKSTNPQLSLIPSSPLSIQALRWKSKLFYLFLMGFNVLSGILTSANIYFFSILLISSGMNLLNHLLRYLTPTINEPEKAEEIAEKEWVQLLSWYFAASYLVSFISVNLRNAHRNLIKSAHNLQENGMTVNKYTYATILASLLSNLAIPTSAFLSTRSAADKIKWLSSSDSLKLWIAGTSALAAFIEHASTAIPALYNIISKELDVSTRSSIPFKTKFTYYFGALFSFLNKGMGNTAGTALTLSFLFTLNPRDLYLLILATSSGLNTAYMLALVDQENFLLDNQKPIDLMNIQSPNPDDEETSSLLHTETQNDDQDKDQPTSENVNEFLPPSSRTPTVSELFQITKKRKPRTRTFEEQQTADVQSVFSNT